MQKTIKTHTFFNLGTQRALYEKVDGYINKEIYIKEHIKELKEKYALNKILRFDLGQNNDGCDSKILEFFQESLLSQKEIEHIKNYPDFICRDLRKKIAALHNIDTNWIFLSAGLEQSIMMIASTFLELNDRFMVNNPSFFLFEEYSKRMGAVSIHLHLNEAEQFDWTGEIFYEYLGILDKLRPKLIWLANPNNPTGRMIEKDLLEKIIKEAADHYAFVVVDEAYGEYTDPNGTVYSASSFLKQYANLIVLRTFSKAYGMANLRVGYAMTSNDEIMSALKIHKTNFPISQISFDLVSYALDRIEYLTGVRKKIRQRKTKFMQQLKNIPDFDFIESNTNIMMLKHKFYPAVKLIDDLEKNGIIVSNIPGQSEVSQKYIRITLGKDFENDYFIEVINKLYQSNQKKGNVYEKEKCKMKTLRLGHTNRFDHKKLIIKK